DLEPQPLRAARLGDEAREPIGLELAQLVAGVDAVGGERRVVHRLGVAPAQRSPDQRDAAGGRRGHAARAAGAASGKRPWGMMARSQRSSWSTSGVIVCSMK